MSLHIPPTTTNCASFRRFVGGKLYLQGPLDLLFDVGGKKLEDVRTGKVMPVPDDAAADVLFAKYKGDLENSVRVPTEGPTQHIAPPAYLPMLEEFFACIKQVV